jgi:hypothetical protein
VLDWGQSDDAGQRENIVFWIGDKLGIPFLQRRQVTLIVNGLLPSQRPLTGYHPLSAKVYWDAQEPDGDVVDEWFHEDGNDGRLYKLHHLVFGSSEATVYGFHLQRFVHFIDSTSQRHPATYRWHYRLRGQNQGGTDLSNVFRLLDALNSPDSGYVPTVQALVEVEEWMRMFALERIIGNLDSVGWDNGHNMYAYYSPERGWHLLPYDCELSLATPTGPWYDTSPTKDLFTYTYDDSEFKGDNTLGRMKQNAAFQRAYWRAFRDAINGPLVTTNFLPVMQRYQAALVANGVSVAGPSVMQTYLETRREYIRGRLATVNATFAVTSPAPNATLNSNLVTIAGTAPVEVATIAVNGVASPVTWTSVTTWALTIALPPGTQSLAIQALDPSGGAIAGMAALFNVQVTVPPAASETNVVINEIMYHPATPGAEFLELHNRSTTTAFDLSGWKLNGLDFTFPSGSSIAPRGFVVVAADRLAFGQAYGFGIPVAGVFKGSFDQGGETVTLLRPAGTNEIIVDSVTFEDDAPWPPQADGGGPSLQLIDPALDNNRVANWAAVTNPPGARFTPGAPNQVLTTNPPPLLWLNELQVINVAGPMDGRGQHEPWVELYNGGSAVMDLAGFFLSNEPTNLNRWVFPPGSILGAGQFRLVWLDGDVSDHTATEWHANFRLTTNDTLLLLARDIASQRQIVDYLPLTVLPADGALARVPDGTSDRPRVLDYTTAGASNSGASPLPAIYINELMAANTLWLDPADGDSDDWFELYNASDRAVNLAGYSLTDKTSLPRKFVIPAGVAIGAHDFLLVWADEEESQTRTNGHLHVNFRLNDAGEAIAFYSPDGRLIDSTFFGVQTPDTSLARWPDGTGSFTGTTNATPGMHNKLNGSMRPALSLTAVIVPGVGVRIFFPPGYDAAVLCKARLEDPSWSAVNGTRGYDAATDQEWMLDTTIQGTQQRFYRALGQR